MPAVCFYFQVHQPMRLRRYRIFDIGNDQNYFNEDGEHNRNNRRVLEKVARKSYLPTNETILQLLKKYPDFKVSYSLSGVFLDQLREYSPETLDSFKRLVDTGQVELLGETYYHSLSFLYSKPEFREQVEMHRKTVKDIFGVSPKVFRNTELIYRDDVGKEAESLGFAGVLAEGAERYLGWRSPNFVYQPPSTAGIRLLLKNYRLSDDIAFRFSSRDWSEWPLRAEKFASWVNAVNGTGDIVNLFMDYETFGEHQWEETGIFDFLRALPSEILRHPDNTFVTPTEAVTRFPARDVVKVPDFMSWADIERDLSAWLENEMQRESLSTLYGLEEAIRAKKDPVLLHDWRRLQTSDHFYYMCTKWFADGDVHKYFNPYESPYEAFINFTNVLHDLQLRI